MASTNTHPIIIIQLAHMMMNNLMPVWNFSEKVDGVLTFFDLIETKHSVQKHKMSNVHESFATKSARSQELNVLERTPDMWSQYIFYNIHKVLLIVRVYFYKSKYRLTYIQVVTKIKQPFQSIISLWKVLYALGRSHFHLESSLSMESAMISRIESSEILAKPWIQVWTQFFLLKMKIRVSCFKIRWVPLSHPWAIWDIQGHRLYRGQISNLCKWC